MTTTCAAMPSFTNDVIVNQECLFEAMFAVLKHEVLSAADTLVSTQLDQPVSPSQQQCATILYDATDLPRFCKQLLRIPNGVRHGNFWHNRLHVGTHTETTLKDKLRNSVERLCPAGTPERVYGSIQALYTFSVVHDLPCYMISGSMYAGLIERRLRSKSFVIASSAEDAELIETLFALSPPPNLGLMYLDTRGW